MAVLTTKTDTTVEWLIADDVIRLRLWGTDRIFTLPSALVDEYLIGSGESCALRLDDERVSRKHALLRRVGETWHLIDLDSKNGVRQDGAQLREPCVLEPGVEIGIGGVVLIAESERWIALRGFCARILGWTSERMVLVDEMLRSIRLAARLRTPLRLGGESDMVPVAHALHRYTHGDSRPFVLCDPRRRDVEESVRAVANHEVGLEALEAARGGSLCMRAERPPHDIAEVLRRVREQDARVQLIVCSKTRGARAANDVTSPIVVPPLKGRVKEVARIVDEYVLDALAALHAPRSSLTRSDRDWIIRQAATTLPEIEKAALRLIALRTTDTIAAAAVRLGMAPVSLTRWIDRRRPPMRGRPGLDTA